MEMGFGKYSARESRWVAENDDSYVRSMFSHGWGIETVRAEQALGRPDAAGRGHYQPDRFSASLQDDVVPWTS